MKNKLSIMLLLAVFLCVVLAEINSTDKIVAKRYSAPYGSGNDNSYGNGYGYRKPTSYGSQPLSYGPPPPTYGQQYRPNMNKNENYKYYRQPNNNGFSNRGYGNNNYNSPQLYDTYGNNNGYNNNYENSYANLGPFHFHNKDHYYDTHYCSVHGSFSLAYTKKEKSETPKEQKDSEDGGNESYVNNGNHSQKKHVKHTRYYTRQYCRYAAISSDKACHFCCRVVARSSNTSPDDIVSAIFAFDPIKPTENEAGFSTSESTEADNGDELAEKANSIFQCVCCAPKHKNY